MNLVIDIGNTLCKVAVFDGDSLLELWTGESPDEGHICTIAKKHGADAAIVSSVRKKSEGRVPAGLGFLEDMGLKTIVAGPDLKLPVKILYKTPGSLGTDRIASAVAAHYMFPGRDVLIINAGTCLTSDFVNSKGHYIGGTIAPGLRMRFRALSDYTGNLPLPDTRNQSDHELNFPGQTTIDSIKTGVVAGMTAEIDGLIGLWREKIRKFNVIMSGGDIKTFDKKLKNRIFAVENIVLLGLNQMLKHNV